MTPIDRRRGRPAAALAAVVLAVFAVAAAGQAPGPRAPRQDAPGASAGAVSLLQQPAGESRRDDGAGAGEASPRPGPPPNPVMQLDVDVDPSRIDEETARRILTGLGLLKAGGRLQRALETLRYSHTYVVSQRRGLTSQDRQWLHADLLDLRAALGRWGTSATVDRSHPMFATWMSQAAAELTAVKVCERMSLLRAMVLTESSAQHWVEWIPVQSSMGATGFAQILGATARAMGSNRYDPEENLAGAARYLNVLIRTMGLLDALAFYNGGTNPSDKKQAYARAVAARVTRCGHGR
jgi:hypothetical protein